MDHSPRSLQPSRTADDLAMQLVAADDVHRTILAETIDAAQQGQVEESGRTICGPNDSPRGPLARYPTAVELEACPRGEAGVWHTHVDVTELRDPEHSIPDIANVVFGEATASMVVGTQSGEVFVRATDPQAMRQEFADILDVEDLQSVRDVNAAISGWSQERAGRAHDDVRARMSDLVWRVNTDYSELNGKVDSLTDTLQGIKAHSCLMHDHEEPATAEPVEADAHWARSPDAGRLRERSRMCSHGMKRGMERQKPDDLSIRKLVISSVVGNLVGAGVSRVLSNV